MHRVPWQVPWSRNLLRWSRSRDGCWTPWFSVCEQHGHGCVVLSSGRGRVYETGSVRRAGLLVEDREAGSECESGLRIRATRHAQGLPKQHHSPIKSARPDPEGRVDRTRGNDANDRLPRHPATITRISTIVEVSIHSRCTLHRIHTHTSSRSPVVIISTPIWFELRVSGATTHFFGVCLTQQYIKVTPSRLSIFVPFSDSV